MGNGRRDCGCSVPQRLCVGDLTSGIQQTQDKHNTNLARRGTVRRRCQARHGSVPHSNTRRLHRTAGPAPAARGKCPRVKKNASAFNTFVRRLNGLNDSDRHFTFRVFCALHSTTSRHAVPRRAHTARASWLDADGIAGDGGAADPFWARRGLLLYRKLCGRRGCQVRSASQSARSDRAEQALPSTSISVQQASATLGLGFSSRQHGAAHRLR